MEDAEGFISYSGEGNPLRPTQGAIVRLRSGELAVIGPSDTDEFDLDTDVLWNHAGDGDDIVAYKLLPPTAAEQVARAAIEYINFEEWLANHPASSHPLNREAAASLKRKLGVAIMAYKESWPDWPETRSLRRLRKWGDEVEE